MIKKRIKQPKRSYSSLTGVVPVWNYNQYGMPEHELVRFESQVERDFILRTSFCIDCNSIRRCEPIIWRENGREKKYLPDFDVLICDEDRNPALRYLVEVKKKRDLEKKAADLEPKFEAARRHCKERGWKFIVQTEEDIQDVFLRNAIFLREFRGHEHGKYPLSDIYGVEKHIIELLFEMSETTPNGLLAAISNDKWERAAYIPHVWRLLCCNEIRANLFEPLTMESAIWHPENDKMEGGLWRRFLS